MPPINHIKARVELLCRGRGMSLPQLAKLIGITKQGLHKILSARRPTQESLGKLALALGVPQYEVEWPVTVEEYGTKTIPRHKE